MVRYIGKWVRVLDRSLIAGAWIFIACTLLQFAWIFDSLQRVGEPQATSISTTSEGVTYSAIGLTYSGWFGVALASAQLTIVVIASVLSVAGRGRLRAAAHVTLIAWAALYAANVLWLTSLAPVWIMLVVSTIMCAFLLCTVYRAVRCRSKRPRRQANAEADLASVIDGVGGAADAA